MMIWDAPAKTWVRFNLVASSCKFDCLIMFMRMLLAHVSKTSAGGCN